MDAVKPGGITTVAEAQAHLFALRRFGVKWGLGPTASALRALGSPQRAFPAAHVAGTNGKGSTAAMTAALLTAQGLRCGLFTSPHLERFSERIRVDGAELDDGALVRTLARVRGTGGPLSFFETAFCMAMCHFADVRVDVAVVEVGLGGRLDATQWIRPCASAITSLGEDHALSLTADPARVAWEKASIAAPGVPFVVPAGLTPVQEEAVLRTLAARGAVAMVRGRDWDFTSGDDAEWLDWRFRGEPDVRVPVPLAGVHMPANCAVALTLARLTVGRPLDLRAPFAGFAWPGRLETIDGLTLDGAHNPPALAALADTLRARGLSPLPVVVGFMADKDVDRSLRLLAPVASGFVCTQVAGADRALPADALADRVRALGLPLLAIAPDVAEALALVPRPALVTGSFYLAGAARSLLLRHAPADARLTDPAAR